MKQALALLAVGVLALMLQSVAALFLPARFLPDLGLLLVIGIALCVRSTAVGLVLAAALGFATDLLSGSLLGQHALLRLAAFGAARFGSARLNLRGPLPQALFVMLICLGYAGGLWALAAFFAPDAGAPVARLRDLAPHALVTGLASPLVTGAVAWFSARIEGDDAKPMRLEPRALSR